MSARIGDDLPAPCFVLRCSVCGREHAPAADRFTCSCRASGVLEVAHDLERASRTLTREALRDRPATVARYAELLPVRPRFPLAPVVTPVHDAPRLARALGVASAVAKFEGGQPTGSLKDRASAVAVARAQALGHDAIACASSGNAAISMAAMAAASGMRAYAFVGRGVPPTKARLLAAYGATTFVVDGTYEDAFALCGQAADTFGWHDRRSGVNPYPVEGKKTCGLELAEQLDAVDWLVVPVGDGCTVTGIWKGLQEAVALGLARRLPRLLAVQSEAAAPIARAWREGTAIATWPASSGAASGTVADSIDVREPHNGSRALAAIRASGGAALTVGDAEISAAAAQLRDATGLLAEPASAAAVAGVVRAREDGLMQGRDRVALVVTGTGLKAVPDIAVDMSWTVRVAPLLDAVVAAVEGDVR